jgi:hypothetical protein
MKREVLKDWIHTLSVLFVLIAGPGNAIGHYLIVNDVWAAAVYTAFFIILILFGSTLLFKIRFSYTILGVLPFTVTSWVVLLIIKARQDIQTDQLVVLFIAATCLFLTCIATLLLSYNLEKSMRLQFLSDRQFLNINQKLHDQLFGLLNGYSTKIADLDSPLEKAIYGIKALLASPDMSPSNLQTLQLILACLNSTNMFAPDFASQLKAGTIELPEEQRV